jgi:hypothetical protein
VNPALARLLTAWHWQATQQVCGRGFVPVGEVSRMINALLDVCACFFTPDEMTRLVAEAERLLGEARQTAESRSPCVNV